jgi:hypothetical protein
LDLFAETEQFGATEFPYTEGFLWFVYAVISDRLIIDFRSNKSMFVPEMLAYLKLIR